ncbi:hypothetical protein LAZ67_14000288 [Cordylochernes scorpioides]|uniref:Myotrophin n=1 Tax=Cordylochernes scorpioides TaxID=51811 RepID=A0ABY6L5I2_9ARAC|nr:hypothetical protein LAZ67_14000285 [Cordylochernes scorpioides]UYV76400.1 hypothetical protein LAZ67_14000288 [Cordylochernes scorpioides]
MSDFLWSLKNGELEQVREHVESKKVDVNSSIDGRLPIHYAADYGQAEVVNYLIEKGADVNAQDKYGITALLAAIWEGHTKCVKLMIEKGAKKTGLTPDGTSYIDSTDKEEIKELLK